MTTKAYELRVTVLLFLTFGTVMLDRMAQLYLGPYLLTDLGLKPSQIGLLASVTGVCWALSAIAFGFVSDRVGRKKVLIPAVVVFSLLSWLSGLARTFEELLVIRALMGLAEGPCWSVIMALMDGSSRPERRGRNLGVVNSAGSLVGSAIAPIFCTQLASAFGWRGAFFVVGIPGLMLALLLLLFVKDPEKSAVAERPTFKQTLGLLRRRDLWLCFLGAALVATWLFGVGVFAPLYITQVLGRPATTAGFILGASGFGGFLFGLLWPALSDRVGRKPVLLAAAALAALLPVILLCQSLYAWPWLVAGLALACTAGPAVAAMCMVIMPVELAPRAYAATAVGMVSVGAEMLGAGLSPTIGGALADKFGLGAPLVMAACASGLIVLIALAMRETRVVGSARADHT